jgi:hypothetical protein
MGAAYLVHYMEIARARSPLTSSGVTLLAKFDGEFASRSTTYGGTGTIRYRW